MTPRSTIFADAFEAIGIANYVFDVSAEEQASAARKLDSMMAEWEGDGVVLGYLPTGGNPLPDVAMLTPTWADSAISTNLALRIAPSFGKQVLPSIKGDAKRGYSLVVAKALKPPTKLPSRATTIGAGSLYRRVFP